VGVVRFTFGVAIMDLRGVRVSGNAGGSFEVVEAEELCAEILTLVCIVVV
jgi:hypothetical protein